MPISVKFYLFFQTVFCCLFLQAGESSGNAQRAAIDESQTPRIEPLTESQWNEKQQQLLNPFKIDGHVFNLFSTLARNPALLEAMNPQGFYLLRGSSIPPREREMLILRIAWLAQSEYEFGQHTVIALQAGLSIEEITRITQGPDVKAWTGFEASLLLAVDELHQNSVISDATWIDLTKQYNDIQIMDMIATVGQYRMLAMLLNSLKINLDEGIPGYPNQEK
jgi:4-carboxymuconolactone decarboxylase